MQVIEVKVLNKLGLHARPIAQLVRASEKMNSEITVQLGDRSAKVDNIYALMALGAKRDDVVKITADGITEEQDIILIKEMFENNFGET